MHDRGHLTIPSNAMTSKSGEEFAGLEEGVRVWEAGLVDPLIKSQVNEIVQQVYTCICHSIDNSGYTMTVTVIVNNMVVYCRMSLLEL